MRTTIVTGMGAGNSQMSVSMDDIDQLRHQACGRKQRLPVLAILKKMPHAIDVGWNAVLIIRKNFERMQPAA